MSEPARLATVKGDAEKAQEYKERMADLLQPVCALMDEAKKDKMDFVFNVQPDAMGRHFVSNLKVTREF